MTEQKWIRFYKQTDPLAMQKQTDPSTLKGYYTNTDFNKYRNVDNVSVKPLNWGLDPCINQIIVGDIVTISEPQAIQLWLKTFNKTHSLTAKIPTKVDDPTKT